MKFKPAAHAAWEEKKSMVDEKFMVREKSMVGEKSPPGRNSSNVNFICNVYGIIPIGFNFNEEKLRPGRNPWLVRNPWSVKNSYQEEIHQV